MVLTSVFVLGILLKFLISCKWKSFNVFTSSSCKQGNFVFSNIWMFVAFLNLDDNSE